MNDAETLTTIMLIKELKPVFAETMKYFTNICKSINDNKKILNYKDSKEYQTSRKQLLLLHKKIRELETKVYNEAFFMPSFPDDHYKMDEDRNLFRLKYLLENPEEETQ